MSAPRWVAVITEILERPENKKKFTSLLYQLATVDAKNRPHVRTVGHHNFLLSKGAPHLPLLFGSTYTRSAKVQDIIANPSVELSWLIEGTSNQFRVSGRAFVVPSPDNKLFEECAQKMKRSLALAVLESQGEEGKPEGEAFSWEALRLESFNSVPPTMRAKWCVADEPGTVLKSYEELSKYPVAVPPLERATTEEQKKNWQEAFNNFALVVIEPYQVEWLQLDERPNRKTVWTKTDEDEWKEEIVL
ncbi:hypothetical protein EIP86_010884 [Pleurotus ostreatoroseus]|nr:hypothetical protein EIP86_010884 [Pleurotus ostreatoroseus]